MICKLIFASYRRGKPQSNDVDIVITHTDWELGSQKVKGLCRKLVRRLHGQGQLSAEILPEEVVLTDFRLGHACHAYASIRKVNDCVI